MCEYDEWGSYTALSQKLVVTRCEHACNSCETYWPAKTEMIVSTGIYEGDFTSYRMCPICWWAERQPDHTDLHICANWGPNPDPGYHRSTRARDSEVFNYLCYCYENGEWPTVTQLAAIVKQIRIADGDWEEEAA